MRCRSCNGDSPAGDAFCGTCGAQLVLICASCGRTSPVERSFCGGCGRRLERDAPAERDVRSHTPLHLAERILVSRGALEGERKQVTVLFADVRDSLALAERLDPEAWHGILDRFFRILADGVALFEGTINQFTGDGIMALFGAPLAHEDHAQRACHAALHLAERLSGFADEVVAEHGLAFAVRMGIDSGDVVVGRIGDDLRMDYTAQGHTVGLAARLQELAAPGRIVIGGGSAVLVGDLFRLEPLGPVRLKGLADPVQVYALLGTGELRTRLDVARSRGLTGFVGRGDEMAALEAALRRTLDGRGVAMGVVGAPGVGKSRLCEEFVQSCRERNVAVIEAHCLSHARSASLGVLRDVLRGALGVTGDADPEQARVRVAQRVADLDGALVDTLPSSTSCSGSPTTAPSSTSSIRTRTSAPSRASCDVCCAPGARSGRS